LRAIANLGREDVLIDGLTPVQQGVRILGASSDHLVMDVTDARPPLSVGDRVAFRMDYGAMLAVMTSEYVEKVPMNDVEPDPGPKLMNVFAEPATAHILTDYHLREGLEAIGYDLVTPEDATVVSAGSTALYTGTDRRVALLALAAATAAVHSLGLIWIDARATLFRPEGDEAEIAETTTLARILGQGTGARPFQPQLSPENAVLVGLREVAPAEAAILKKSRATAFTMADIDALGMREVMRQALGIATNGTGAFHVCYSPNVTDMPGQIGGSGGITVRETHQAMEAIALTGTMISMSVAGLTPNTDGLVMSETAGFILSAFGKRIL
jgi:arginase family enzyme